MFQVIMANPDQGFSKGCEFYEAFCFSALRMFFLGQPTPTTQWWSNRCTTDYRVFLDWPTQQQHVSCNVFHWVKGWKKIKFVFFGSIPKITPTVILETSSSSSLWRMGAPSFLEFFLGNMGVQWWFIYLCLKKRIPLFKAPKWEISSLNRRFDQISISKKRQVSSAQLAASPTWESVHLLPGRKLKPEDAPQKGRGETSTQSTNILCSSC